MVLDFQLVGEQRGERIGVSRSDHRIGASRVRGRSVRAHAAADGAHRRLDDQLVEAGQRVGLAVGIEVLEARQKAIASEDPELEELPLEGAASSAVGAKERPPPEERIRLQAEDLV